MTVLVFVGVAALSMVVLAFALSVSGRFLGFSTDYLIEKIVAVAVALGGGTFAAYKYRGKGEG